MATETAGLAATTQLFRNFWHPKQGSPTHQAAIAQSLKFLGENLNKTLTAGMYAGYTAVMSPLTPEQCVTAFSRALEGCQFFPTPAQLRGYARGPEAEIDPTRLKAMAEFRALRHLLALHGARMVPRAGRVLSDRSTDGRALPVAEWIREPDIPCPALSLEVSAALAILGDGDPQTGIDQIMASPAMRSPEDRAALDARYASLDDRAQAKLEERWEMAWRAATK